MNDPTGRLGLGVLPVTMTQSEGRLTFTDSRYSVENFLRAKAHYLHCRLQIDDCGLNRPVVLWGAGKTGRRLLKHLLREGVDVEAIVDIDPNKIGHKMRGRPIVSVDYLRKQQTARPYVIAAVSSHGARELIRAQLKELGLAEMHDCLCAA